jgi:small multidrug resistance family-3 protein
MLIAKSLLLFALAAVAEIGGAWLVWQGVREHRGWIWMGAGVIALGLYGFVATLQPDAHFGRILAAYGGVFVAGSSAEPQIPALIRSSTVVGLSVARFRS